MGSPARGGAPCQASNLRASRAARTA